MSSISTQPLKPTSHNTRRQLAAWIQLAALLSFAALALPFFFGRVYVADDLGAFHLPVRNFYAEQLRLGQAFDWMASLYGGFYIVGEGQLGAYHPLHLLLYRWLPLGAAFDLELLVSYPLMFAGTFFFLRRLLERREAALFGALVFTFSSFSLLHFIHPNAIAVVAHIPWLLVAADVAITSANKRNRAWTELGVGLLTASQILLGYPQYVWFSLLIEASYVVWRSIETRAAWQRGALWALAKALGVLAAAVQLLPTMDALSDSVRRTPDATFAATGSLHPLNVVQLVAPYLFQTRVVGQNTHELGLYIGAVPLVLCVWLWTHRQQWGQYGAAIRASLVFGAFALLLAAGEFGGVERLQNWLPLVNRFRFPCRAIVLVELCLAVNAAVAFALLLNNTGSHSHAKPGAGHRSLIAMFSISLALAAAGPLLWPEFIARWQLVALGPLLFAVAAALVACAQRGARGALIAMVLFTAIDLTAYGLSYSVFNKTADLHEFVADSRTPPHGVQGRVATAEADSTLRTGNRMLLAGVSRADGYAGLEPAKRLNYSTSNALATAGVGWVLNASSDTKRGEALWTMIATPAPRARLVTETVSADSPTGLTNLGNNRAAVDEPIALEGGTPGTVAVTNDTIGRITLDVDAPSRQLLVTTESFHPGWRAVVDGRVQQVVRVNGDFLGSVIEPGSHHVVLEFAPASLRWGRILTACGLGLLCCLFLVRRYLPPTE